MRARDNVGSRESESHSDSESKRESQRESERESERASETDRKKALRACTHQERNEEQVDIPSPPAPRPTTAWKLMDAELEQRIDAWFDLLELMLTPCPRQELEKREARISHVVRLHFETCQLIVHSRRRMARLRARESALQAKAELWGFAQERLHLHEVQWAAVKIQSLHRCVNQYRQTNSCQ